MSNKKCDGIIWKDAAYTFRGFEKATGKGEGWVREHLLRSHKVPAAKLGQTTIIFGEDLIEALRKDATLWDNDNDRAQRLRPAESGDGGPTSCDGETP